MEVGRNSQSGTINIDYRAKTTMSTEEQAQVVIKQSDDTSKSSENLNGEHEKTPKEDVVKAVDKLNKFLEGEKVHAEYAVHEKLGDVMIKIIDNNTKEIILEVPPKKILDMIAKMMETVGILIDRKA
jgi:flagellar protein FlaG